LSDEEVGRIVAFHFYEGITLTYDNLECGETLTSVGGDTSRTKCDQGHGDDAKHQNGNGNTIQESLPTISIQDIGFCNGVAHSIDHLMLPVHLDEFVPKSTDDSDFDAGSDSDTKEPTCVFCNQSNPILHDDDSYVLERAGSDGSDITVTPMTVIYDFELYDGQNLFTDAAHEHIPNTDFDYAVLGMTNITSINRETNEFVSLDELYVHHFTFVPLSMVGSEVLSRNESIPYMSYPDGYGLYVNANDTPYLYVNAHVISNKDLAPINGSIPLAHKQCNECYWGPEKGSDCTPEKTGTFECCGDSNVCRGGKECTCITNTETDTSKTTKYRISATMLISKDMDKLKRVDQWTLEAPQCQYDRNFKGIFFDYPEDNFCYNNSDLGWTGGGSTYHQVPQNDIDPYFKTRLSAVAPTGGELVWAQVHLHTGAVNATLSLNGKIICTAGTVYGTNPDPKSNARNEQNHLIFIEGCTNIGGGEEGVVTFVTGDVFRFESIYNGGTDDKNFVGVGAAGEHKNVMSIFFMGAMFEGDDDFMNSQHTSLVVTNDMWTDQLPQF